MLHGMQANQGLRVSMEIGRVERDRRVRRLVDKERKPMHRLREQPMYRRVEKGTPMYRRVKERQPMHRLAGKEVDRRLNRRAEHLRRDLDHTDQTDQAGHMA